MDDRAEQEGHVPAAVLDALRSRALTAGIPVERVAAELGVDTRRLNGHGQLDLAGFLRLRGRLGGAMDCGCGKTSGSGSRARGGAILAGLPARGSLVDAMRCLAGGGNHPAVPVRGHVERRDGSVAFVLDTASAARDEAAFFSAETALLSTHALLGLLLPTVAGAAWQGVELRRPKPPASVPFSRHVPCRFGAAADALVYRREPADRSVSMPQADAITIEAITKEELRLVEGPPDDRAFSAEVRRLIVSGAFDQSSVAAALGMSVATLRRRLTGEDTSFRALRTSALRELADDLLASDRSLAVIADCLGFSDVRSFSRAFKSWTGETPNARRRALASR